MADEYEDTPPGGKHIAAGYASRQTVELYHRENQKASAKLDERLRELEITNERQLTKLEAMEKTLGQIVARVEAKPVRWLSVVGILVPIVALIAAWVWQAARYPERGE